MSRMPQPNGTVVGAISMQKVQANRVVVWLCSRHQVGTRIRFWERTFHVVGQDHTLVRETVTDEFPAADDADIWFEVKLRKHLNERFSLAKPPEGQPGPLGGLTFDTGHEAKQNG